MKLLLKKVRTRTWIALGMILTLLPVIFLALYRPSSPEAGWFDDSYAYRKKITFTHNAELTNRRVAITVDTAALTTDKMQADCDDTRFTDINGQLLDFQLTADCDTSSTDYDVVFPIIQNGTNVAYIYYGNPGATTASRDVSAVTSLSPSGGAASLGSEEKGQGPVAYWSFDEGHEATANDSTSNANDGTINGAGWKTEDLCISEKCLYFDGNDYVLVTDSSSLDTTTLTFQTWIKFNATSGNQTIINKKDPWNDTNGFYIEWQADSNQWAVFGSSDSFATIADTISGSEWNHYSFVISGTSVAVYKNGSQLTTSGSITEITTNGDNVYLGSFADSSSYFKGFMDEVKIYNYARSATQIQTDYNSKGGNEGSSVVLGASNPKFLSNGLVGYWKMDETSGNATDSSGNTFTMTNNNTVAYAGGKFGNGGDFESGSSEYFQFELSTNPFSSSDELTASAWIKPESNTASTSYDIIEQQGSLLPNGYTVKQFGDEIQVIIGDVSTFATVSTTAANLSTGSWYHIAAVYKKGDPASITIYINGVMQDTSTSGTIPTTLNAAGDRITIGAQDAFLSSPINYYDGIIDDVRLYKRAFPSQEITDLYNWAPGPVGHWKMDENTGTTAHDTSGNGNSLAPDSTSPTWDSGKLGSALNFDGDANQMEMSSDVAAYDFTDGADFTAMGWFKMTNQTSRDLLSKRGNFNSSSAGYSFNTSSSGTKLTFEVSDGTDEYSLVSGTSLSEDTWYHFAVSWDDDSSTNTGMYINGVKESATATGTFANVGSLDSSSPLRLAAMSLTPSEFQGLLDDVKIYNYARTQSQILEDMGGRGGSSSGTLPQPVVHYSFDEQNGQTTRNEGIGGSSQDGTLGSSSSVASNDPTWKTQADCKANGCLSLDGGDYVDGGSSLTLSDSVTISSWIYLNSHTAWTSIVDRYGGEALDCVGLGFNNSNGQTLMFAWNNPQTGSWPNKITGTRTIPLSQWVHVAVSSNGSTAQFYINGQPDGSPQASGAPCNTGNITLGVNFPGSDEYVNGLIDEVKIYNTALTADQIKQDYNMGSVANFGVGQNEADDLSDGAGNAPVGYWNFEEGIDNTCTGGSNDVCDKSGSAIDGVWAGTGGWYRGKVGKAGSFNGTDTAVTLNNASSSSAIKPALPLTISGWVYFKDLDLAPIIRTDTWQQSVAYRGVIMRAHNGAIEVSYGSGGGTGTAYRRSKTTGTVIEAGEWTHIAAVVQGATNMQIYVNGVDVGGTYSGSGGTMAYSTTATQIGRGDPSNSSDYLNGYIDELKIYDYARTPAQIAYDYNRGEPIAHWRFDECQGTTAYDSSGNAINGTINVGDSGTYTSAGNCVSGTSTHAWYGGATGKINSSFGFDGTDDHILTSDNNAMDFGTGDFTLTAWVKGNNFADGDVIFSKTNGNSCSATYGFHFAVFSSKPTLHFCSTTGSHAQIQGQQTLSTGQWYHLVIVVDRDSSVNTAAYVNGKLVTTTVSNLASHTGSIANSLGIGIGNESDADSGFWDGQIDDIRAYNYALSAEQIRKLYNNASSIFFN